MDARSELGPDRDRGEAALRLAREWRDSHFGPLPHPDELMARILRCDAQQSHSNDCGNEHPLRQRASYWHAKASQLPRDHLHHAHYLRLLQQKADFMEVKTAEKRLRYAGDPPPDNDALVVHQALVFQAHLQRKARARATEEQLTTRARKQSY